MKDADCTGGVTGTVRAGGGGGTGTAAGGGVGGVVVDELVELALARVFLVIAGRAKLS